MLCRVPSIFPVFSGGQDGDGSDDGDAEKESRMPNPECRIPNPEIATATPPLRQKKKQERGRGEGRGGLPPYIHAYSIVIPTLHTVPTYLAR